MLDLLKPNFRESVKQKQAKQKEYHDRRRSRQLNVEEGDQVFVRVYREGLIRWRPGIVIEVIGNRAVRVKLQSGTEVTRHLDQIQTGSFDVPLAYEISMDTEVDTHMEPITGLDSPSPAVDSPAKEATEFSSPTVEGTEREASEPDSSVPDPPPSGSSPVPSERQYPNRTRRPPECPWFVHDF